MSRKDNSINFLQKHFESERRTRFSDLVGVVLVLVWVWPTATARVYLDLETVEAC